jgi:hypothetical protein
MFLSRLYAGFFIIESAPMLLYVQHITSRLQYIIDFIGKELFNEPIAITTDKVKFMSHVGPKINYSGHEFSEEEFFICQTALLFETGIKEILIDSFELNYTKVFFQTYGDFPFDIFAASFYLISRYEEYLPYSKDVFGRYAYTNSLAWKEGFLQIPIINFWLLEFKKSLQKKFSKIIFRHRSFRFIPTYDIDIAYSYLHKGWKRNMGGLAKSIVNGQWAMARERIAVLRRKKNDPFDAYEWLDSLHLYCRVKPYYFFLVAKEQKEHDRNIAPNDHAMQDLIQYHASGNFVGIHPSWQSGDETGLLKEEIEWLEYIAERKIEHSRQHYIRLTLPETYRRLLKAGIKKDFSMGFGSLNGFRASVASSFYWYDLEKEEQTVLQVYPFCFMDANSFFEQKLTPQQAMEELLYYYRMIKKVNGLMITIWHNNFLGTDRQFEGWKQVYEVFLKEEVYWDT